MPASSRQSTTAAPASAPTTAPTTGDRSAQGRYGNAFVAEQLAGSRSTPETTGAAPATTGTAPATTGPATTTTTPATTAAPPGTTTGSDQAWADAPLTRMTNAAPVQAGRQERTAYGVRIIGTDVSPTALDACERFVRLTIGQRPDIQERMQRANVALVIVPRNRAMTEVAEFAGLAGQNTFDGRPWSSVRGSGGRAAPGGLWAIAVPEENLVQTSPDNDAYGAGYSVGLHEFSHTIQSKGLSSSERREVDRLYEARRRAGGPWTEAYGASNDQEYFAQATNCFFSANGGVGQNGPEWLEQNDRPMFDFLVRLYGQPPRRPAQAPAPASGAGTGG